MARRITTEDGRAALAAVAGAEKPARTDLATAVRYLLQLLVEHSCALLYLPSQRCNFAPML